MRNNSDNMRLRVVKLLLALSALLCFLSCSANKDKVVDDRSYSLLFSDYRIYLNKGDSFQIHYRIVLPLNLSSGPDRADAISEFAKSFSPGWTSSDEAVATVDQDGIIHAINPGECYIDMNPVYPDKYENVEKTKPCKITVLPDEAVSLVYSAFYPVKVVREDESFYYIGAYEVSIGDYLALIPASKTDRYGSFEEFEKRCYKPCYFSYDYSILGRNAYGSPFALIDSLNAYTGLSFRLPTLEEWQYAASGGPLSHGYKYSGSNSLDEVGWYTENFHSTFPSANSPYYYLIGQKKPNELGLYDCSGGIQELCTMPEDSELPYAVCGGYTGALARYCEVSAYELADLNRHFTVSYLPSSCGMFGLRLVVNSLEKCD